MNETTFHFGPDAGLVGTLSSAAEAAAMPTFGAILFNAGVVPRIGPNRLNVRIARALAQDGIPTLRFDLSGRGDSAPARGMASFEEQAVADMRAAMDVMTQRTGARRFLLMGICSGAECAYHAALADERIVAISLMDSYHFPTWRTRLNRYRLRARRRGGVLKAGLGWLRNRARGAIGRVAERDWASANFGSIRPSAEEFAGNLQRLIDRGVKIDLLFSGSFVETYNYAGQFRDGFKRYGISEAINAEYRSHLDHTLSTAAMQREVVERTCSYFRTIAGRREQLPRS